MCTAMKILLGARNFAHQFLCHLKKTTYVQLISKLSSTPQKSRSRFITVFSTCEDAFLKVGRHVFI
jgi:hypothetical protein